MEMSALSRRSNIIILTQWANCSFVLSSSKHIKQMWRVEYALPESTEWKLTAECMSPTVCFFHWGQDKCDPPQHTHTHTHTRSTQRMSTVNKERWLGAILSVGLKDNHLQQETELHGVQFPANRREGRKNKSISLYLDLRCFLYDQNITTYPCLCYFCLAPNVGLIEATYFFWHLCDMNLLCVPGFCLSTVWYVGINK